MSNSRALRRRIQRSLAADDGRVIPVPNACCALELVISPTRLDARHDAHCPALHPTTAAGLTARARGNAAINDVIAGHGYGKPITAMVWP